jgi:predicted ferric reductase
VKALVLVWLFVMNIGAIIAFWWTASGSQPIASSGEELNAIGRVTALVGTYLVLVQLLLLARVPWLEEAFGMERLLVFHRWNAYASLGLISAHAAFQTAGYASINGLGFMDQLGDFIAHYDGLLGAVIALALLIAVTALSVAVVRRLLAYQTWYFIHLYVYLAVALAFAHQLATGVDFISSSAFQAYWWALYAVVVGGLLYFRLLQPLLRFRRHRFRVERIEREATGAVSIYISGRDLRAFTFQPGQFAIWRFLDGRRWWEAHPFTLSTVPSDRRLRLTVKASGDFSSRIASLRRGTAVLVEGPFGRFTADATTASKVLLIAGGIGVTPLRALAEQLAHEGRDVCLLYRCHRDEDVAFRKELDTLTRKYGIRIEYLLSDRPLRGRVGSEWLLPTHLAVLVPDLAEREVYLCGPEGMIKYVKETLDALGVQDARIHTEVFVF